MNSRAQFSIVTPSYNMLGYLRRCHSSIEDQAGVTAEHIVVDACSSDGSPEWLASRPSIRSVIEKDRGMYDALNKGMRLANGEVLAYLNCDEQYLPGTLQAVWAFMDARPEIDLVFGDALIVDPEGSLLAFRKGYTPWWPLILASHLYLLSCSMFIRRRVFDSGLAFDPGLRDVGDMDFVVRALRQGWKAAHCPRYLAAFTHTGLNRSHGHNAICELAFTVANAPAWVRFLRRPLNLVRYLQKVGAGSYWQRRPLEYELYSDDDPGQRRRYQSHDASWRWPESTSVLNREERRFPSVVRTSGE